MVGTEVCSYRGAGPGSMPTALRGRCGRGEGRHTARGCAQTALSALPLPPLSLLCPHLWLPSHSLTADPAVKWGCGDCLGWDKLMAGIAGSTAVFSHLEASEF